MIFGILFSIVFLFLLGKAILETIWGIGLILIGIFWHVVSSILSVLIFIENTYRKLRK